MPQSSLIILNSNLKSSMNFVKASVITVTLAATTMPSAANTPTDTGAIPVSPSVTKGLSTRGDHTNINKKASGGGTRTIVTDDGEEWEIVDDGDSYFMTKDGEEWRVA